MFKTRLERLEEENAKLRSLLQLAGGLLPLHPHNCKTKMRTTCKSVCCTNCTSDAIFYAALALNVRDTIYQEYGLRHPGPPPNTDPKDYEKAGYSAILVP